MAGFYIYTDISQLYRVLGLLAATGVALAITLQTEKGRNLWAFIQDAQVEVRKVVWPTREETIQTTITVLILALIMGVFFWLLDMFLLYATRLLTGQGG